MTLKTVDTGPRSCQHTCVIAGLALISTLSSLRAGSYQPAKQSHGDGSPFHGRDCFVPRNDDKRFVPRKDDKTNDCELAPTTQRSNLKGTARHSSEEIASCLAMTIKGSCLARTTKRTTLRTDDSATRSCRPSLRAGSYQPAKQSYRAIRHSTGEIASCHATMTLTNDDARTRSCQHICVVAGLALTSTLS